MSLTKQQVTALYIAVYNRAPDAAGLEYWTTEFEGTYAEAAAGFAAHPLFAAEYADLTNQEKVEKFYTNILGSDGDTDGIEYWVERLDDGEDISVILSEFLNASLTGDFSEDPAAQARQDTLLNKVEVGIYYAEKMGDESNMSDDYDSGTIDVLNDPAFKAAQKAIAGVDDTQASVAAAKAVVDNLYDSVPGEEFFLEVGRDNLTGTDNADTFIADIAQNDNGQQVNTLGTGDRLDGGAGNDTLEAQVTAGAYAGGSGNMAIQARTKSVENIKLEAVNFNAASGTDNQENRTSGDEVFVNAKHMENVNYIGSEQSNASLTIQDLTSQGVAGGTKNMTIGMKYTGNKDSQWRESDLNVLFDQDYLTRESDTENGWSYQILNQASWDLNNSEPVKGFPLERITFTLARENMANEKYSLDFTAADRSGLVTQQDLVNALNAKLADLNLTGLEFGLNGTFTDPDGRSSQSINLVNTNEDQEVVAGTVGLDEDSPAGNLYWNNARLDEIVEFSDVTVNVELEKVGRAGDGGELVIGSMNKGADNNVWDAVNTVGENTVSGVEVFNVTVDGGKAESSSLSGMRSTSNNLREVNVVSADGSDANLWIGNSNTSSYDTTTGRITGLNKAQALKDVQTFDASGFNGDLHLQAALTGEVTEKYLEDGDTSFVYTGGTGDDSFDVALSSANLAASGNATHGNFSFKIASGEGDDTITVGIYDGYALAGDTSSTPANATTPWYANQKTNANLRIDAGDGDDTVNLQGSGDWVVDLGDGDDVIYVDNGGNKASWIFNAADSTGYGPNGWADVVGGGNQVYNLYQSGVTLTLKDDQGGEFQLNLTVDGDGANGYQTSQKAINEAIKDAIENDPIFSKLVEAKTGQMADTLIINSLIDGDVVDLAIEIVSPGNLPSGMTLADFNTLFGTNVTATQIAAAPTGNALDGANAVTGGPNADVAYDFTPVTGNAGLNAGTDGNTIGAQTITAGAGDDLLVLGTSSDQLHTLVYEDYGNGTDTVLNFVENTSTGGPVTGDVLDLTSYKAKFVDFGAYTTGTTWATGTGHNAGNDYGKGSSNATNLVVDDVFLRVNEEETGIYTVEAFKVTATGDVSVANATNIENLGTIGTIDFGQDTTLNNLDFII